MHDSPYQVPAAHDHGDLPGGIESAARQWNRMHPGWVATHVADAPEDAQWVADRCLGLFRDEKALGHLLTLRAPNLDALSTAVAEEVARQTPYFTKRAQALGHSYPFGGDAA